MSADRSQGALLNVRVLDQDVVDELAGQLQSLIDRAGEAIQSLEQSASRSDESTTEAARVIDTLGQRLHLGARLVKALADKTTAIEPLLAQLAQRAERSDQAGADLAEQQEQLQSTLDAALDQVAGQNVAAEQSFANLANQAGQLESRLEHGLADIRHHRETADAAGAALDQRIGDLNTRLDDVAHDLDATRQGADDKSAQLDQQLADTRTLVEQTRCEVQEHGAQARADHEVLEKKSAEIFGRVGEATDHLEASRRNTETASRALEQNIDQQRSESDQRRNELAERQEQVEAATTSLGAELEKFRSDFSAAVVYHETRKHDLEKTTSSLQERFEDCAEKVQQALDELTDQQDGNARSRQ